MRGDSLRCPCRALVLRGRQRYVVDRRAAGLSVLGGPGSVGSAYAWGFVSHWGGARVSAIASR